MGGRAGLGVGVGLGIGVGVGVGVGVGIGVGVGSGMGVGVGAGMGVGVGVGIGAGVGIGIGAGVGIGMGVGVGADMGVEVGAGTTKVGVVTVGVGDEGGGVEAWLLQAARAARPAATATSSVSARWGRAFMSNIAMYSPNPSRFLFARKTRVGSRFLGFQRQQPSRH